MWVVGQFFKMGEIGDSCSLFPQSSWLTTDFVHASVNVCELCFNFFQVYICTSCYLVLHQNGCHFISKLVVHLSFGVSEFSIVASFLLVISMWTSYWLSFRQVFALVLNIQWCYRYNKLGEGGAKEIQCNKIHYSHQLQVHQCFAFTSTQPLALFPMSGT